MKLSNKLMKMVIIKFMITNKEPQQTHLLLVPLTQGEEIKEQVLIPAMNRTKNLVKQINTPENGIEAMLLTISLAILMMV